MRVVKKKNKKPLVTVYIVSHNYGRFLSKAIESVLSQSFKDWELLIYDDGSDDDTAEVAGRYTHYPNVSFFQPGKQGLIRTANQAIEQARGNYVIRLDADDYLEENALLIMVQEFKRNPETALVYPDYFVVNEDNVILEHIRQNSITSESNLLDLPAHGACSLIKRSILLKIRKYDPSLTCQDGYDLWLKVAGEYRVKNVNLPLFYYRRHGRNLTGQEHRILSARQQIKERFVKENLKPEELPEVLAIIPTHGTKANPSTNPLRDLAGRKLIDYTLDAVSRAELVSRSIVLSEDDEALAYVSRGWKCETLKRPAALGGLSSRIEESVLWVLKELSAKENYRPDLVLLLYIHAPLRKASHIDEAIYSQIIFNTDSVVSVTQNTKFLYHHGKSGMIPLYEKRFLRHEKDNLYEENAAIDLSQTRAVTKESFLGKTIGHIVMAASDSVAITGEFEFWLCEQILKQRNIQVTEATTTLTG